MRWAAVVQVGAGAPVLLAPAHSSRAEALAAVRRLGAYRRAERLRLHPAARPPAERARVVAMLSGHTPAEVWAAFERWRKAR